MRNFSLLFLLLISSIANAQYSIDSMVVSPFVPGATQEYHKVLQWDLNKDGNMDIIIDGGLTLNQSNHIVPATEAKIMLGNGDGSFTFHSNFIKPSIHHSISDINDYNKDGFADILMYGFWDNGFSLYTGTGNLTFAAPQQFSAGTHGYDANFVDYDGDGDLDILTITSGSTADVLFHVFTNTANNFTHASYSLNDHFFMQNFAYRDINGDGLTDVFANTQDKLFFLFQKPGHTFGDLAIQNLHTSPYYFFEYENYYKSCEDYNNDGKANIAVNQQVTSTNDILNLSLGTSIPPFLNTRNRDGVVNNFTRYYSRDNAPGQFYPSDLDGDGFKDIISFLSNDKVIIHFDPFNFNNKQHDVQIDFGADIIQNSFKGVLVNDYNKDGKKDILLFCKDNNIRVLLDKTVIPPPPPPPPVVNPQDSLDVFTVFPNPASSQITIAPADSFDYFEIFDNLGREMYSSPATIDQTITVSRFAAGIYYLVAYKNNVKKGQAKFLKK